ncbi:MAG: transposase [Patescibacteria group bacterium]
MFDNTLFKNKYRIESTRLKGWDYSSEAYYFITICTKNKKNILGYIKNGFVCLSKQGQLAINCWYDLPKHYSNCVLDYFVIMPNHIHGIIFIDNDRPRDAVETGFKPVSTDGDGPIDIRAGKKRYLLSEIIRGFKTFSAKQINLYQNTIGEPFWQPRFHDRIIRDEKELYNKQKYILNNPLKWELDQIIH